MQTGMTDLRVYTSTDNGSILSVKDKNLIENPDLGLNVNQGNIFHG